MNTFETHALYDPITKMEEVVWINPDYLCFEDVANTLTLTLADILEANQRLERFAPYIMKAFPETVKNKGIIESDLRPIPNMQENLTLSGKLFLKCDHELPVAGSIKARGGIYAVLKYAEALALKEHLLNEDEDYAILADARFKTFYSQYTLIVGSTGNLGISIGTIGAKLGFQVVVHLSIDAKKWKKELLRNLGVVVTEHQSGYTEAVHEARLQASNNPMMYFIDDENSRDLFLGYSVAALRLKKGLADLNITVDEDHPLFVYLPCGVGGGPGGVTLGLKYVFKDHVHCFFAEPTHSPCMLLGLMTGLHEQVCVQDFGMDNKTAADGLAVGRPSGFVGRLLKNLISGIYTIGDERLYQLLVLMKDTEGISLEPSALAGVPATLCHTLAF